ncbi:MAG: alpha/beta fold hydrolase [Acidimicrobiales bacterium]
MGEIVREGVHVHWETKGQGPAILLSHGYSATSQMWADQVEVLAENHQVITWDMRGHGRSDSPDDPGAYSRESTVADMAAVLDALAVDRAAIAGLSLGGYMSLAFHVTHPDRTATLLLFDTGPGYRRPEARSVWNATAGDTARAFDQRGLSALGTSEEVRASTHRSPAGLAHAARGMLTQHDDRVLASLPDVAVPTLVLVGQNDTQFLASADYMAAKIPGAQRVVIPDAGHAANIDQPHLFNRAVLDFLASVPW